MTFRAIIENYPLIAAILAMIFAQVLKLPIYFIVHQRFEPMIMFSNGGMPSSHSAFVSSLTTAVGIEYGLHTPYFAIAAVFALITMWDAAGIRYQASKHARILNILIQDFQNLVEHVKYKSKKNHVTFKELFGDPLKELLGHKPFEVLIGSLLGIIVAMITHYWI